MKLLKLNGKEYKTIINKCKNTKQIDTGYVTIDEFLEHFSTLNSTEENEAEFECNMNGTQMSSSETNEYSESETSTLTHF